jgi:ribulose-phosphate 3-epimerase
MAEVIPAIIPQNLFQAREMLDKVTGIARKAQIDIVDGEYAESVTWPFASKDQGDELFQMIRNEEKFPCAKEIDLELDMMMLHPIERIADFLDLGFKSFVVHIDSTDHVRECIDTIKSAGQVAGLGIRPSVDTDLLTPFLPDVQFVQFMGNDRVGHNGVELDPKVLDKIKQFHETHPAIPLQIDIGVSLETAKSLIDAGISRLVSGSAIFNSPDMKKAIQDLQSM